MDKKPSKAISEDEVMDISPQKFEEIKKLKDKKEVKENSNAVQS